MEIVGFVLAALVGVSLGLIGGGGSILTVPILVYLIGINPVLATSYSLFIVGTTSLIGAFINYKRGYVNIKTALLFGLSSITAKGQKITEYGGTLEYSVSRRITCLT